MAYFLFMAFSVSVICNLLLLNMVFQDSITDRHQKYEIKAKNTISVIDTIYGRKYVVEIDTITGQVQIIGPRTFNPQH